jgi:hypothetical protein
MAKDDKKKKVHSRATLNIQHLAMRVALVIMKMIYFALFANLNMEQKKKKLNELIETINEKDDLLESKEDFLIKENKKLLN